MCSAKGGDYYEKNLEPCIRDGADIDVVELKVGKGDLETSESNLNLTKEINEKLQQFEKLQQYVSFNELGV